MPAPAPAPAMGGAHALGTRTMRTRTPAAGRGAAAAASRLALRLAAEAAAAARDTDATPRSPLTKPPESSLAEAAVAALPASGGGGSEAACVGRRHLTMLSAYSARPFDALHAGDRWHFGEDVASKPGWLCCAAAGSRMPGNPDPTSTLNDGSPGGRLEKGGSGSGSGGDGGRSARLELRFALNVTAAEAGDPLSGGAVEIGYLRSYDAGVRKASLSRLGLSASLQRFES